MTRHPSQPDETMLHAYVDGQLSAPQRESVVAWLAEHPTEAARVESYQRQNEVLRALGEEMAQRPFAMPEQALQVRHTFGVWQAAAVVLLLAFGGFAGWQLRSHFDTMAYPRVTLVHQAAVAHSIYSAETRHAVEVAAAQEAHLVKWLSRRLGNPIKTPSLLGQGFQLMGGRLLPASNGPAAQFMYEDQAGNRLTLYVLSSRQAAGEVSFRFEQRGAVGVFYWLGDTLDYALAGELQRERLLAVATDLHRQLIP